MPKVPNSSIPVKRYGRSEPSPAPRSQIAATDRQLNYIRILAEKLGTDPGSRLEGMTLETAGSLIDLMKAKVAEKRSSGGKVTEDGMYRHPDGTIFKVLVAVHGSGRLYAKRLVKLDRPRELANGGTRTHHFTMVQGDIAKLTPAMKMSREEAMEFGRLYGTCCRCGLTLTDETSIARGIGPDCYKNFKETKMSEPTIKLGFDPETKHVPGPPDQTLGAQFQCVCRCGEKSRPGSTPSTAYQNAQEHARRENAQGGSPAGSESATGPEDRPTPTRPRTTPPKAAAVPRSCACSCGEMTGGGLFRPGHDAKLLSRLAIEVRERKLTIVDALEKLSAMPKLKAKMESRLAAAGVNVK